MTIIGEIKSRPRKKEVGGRQMSARSQTHIKRTKWISSYKVACGRRPPPFTPDYTPDRPIGLRPGVESGDETKDVRPKVAEQLFVQNEKQM